MYTPIVRIILFVVCLAMAWSFYSTGNMISTYMVLLGAGLIVSGYFRNGTVFLAFQQLKKENYEKAEQLLGKVFNPDLLKKSQKSYYYFTKGFIDLNKKNRDASYGELIHALKLGLRTENDTSIVTVTLAGIELERGNIGQARNYLRQTKSLKHKPELGSEIERIELELAAVDRKG
jgi:hypothetical protein